MIQVDWNQVSQRAQDFVIVATNKTYDVVGQIEHSSGDQGVGLWGCHIWI
jgi:hypothetical protein